jgi:thiamine pyrophosphate-dependent acetolactate synthase large subunit-like protein
MTADRESRTGATALIETCTRRGVTRIFGLPGVHNLPIWQAAGEAGIDIVGVRHEQTAVYAADGYARVSGKPALAVVTTGPGAANTLGATGEAMASGVPLVVVATEIPSSLRRAGVYRGVLHENRDQAQMFRPITKLTLTATRADEIGELMRQALDVACSSPTGPVYFGIPTDLLSTGLEDEDTDVVASPAWPLLRGDLDAACALVNASRSPVIWAGGGAARGGAAGAVAELAHRIGAPVITTYSARGLLPASNPDLAPGPAHIACVGELWDDADLVISIGSDLDAVMTQNWSMPQPPALLTLNVDQMDAAKNYEVTGSLVGEAAYLASALARGCIENPSRRRVVRDRNQELAVAVQHHVHADEPAALQLMAAVEGALPPRCALVLDMCIAGYWLAGFARIPDGTSVLYPMGWGTLGYSVPAAVGAACADVDRVICVVGDGGFLFAPGELATISQLNLPITVVIVDDGSYGMLKYDQISHGQQVRGVDLASPDFALLARAFSLDVEQVTGFGEPFATALLRSCQAARPNVVVVSASMKPPPTSSARWYRTRPTTPTGAAAI